MCCSSRNRVAGATSDTREQNTQHAYSSREGPTRCFYPSSTCTAVRGGSCFRVRTTKKKKQKNSQQTAHYSPTNTFHSQNVAHLDVRTAPTNPLERMIRSRTITYVGRLTPTINYQLLLLSSPLVVRMFSLISDHTGTSAWHSCNLPTPFKALSSIMHAHSTTSAPCGLYVRICINAETYEPRQK